MRISDWSSDVCSSDLIGGRRQLRCQELLETLKILGNDLQNKIDFAVQHMAFAHFGKLCHMVFEGLQVSLRLTLQTDHGKYGDAIAQRSRIDHGVVGVDQIGSAPCRERGGQYV